MAEAQVLSMNQRLSGPDYSLNAPFDGEADREWQDQLADESVDQERVLAESQELKWRSGLLRAALTRLTTRERDILIERRLRDEPTTLDDLSQKYGVSHERVRQIELRAFDKLRRAVRSATSYGASREPMLASKKQAGFPTAIRRHDGVGWQ